METKKFLLIGGGIIAAGIGALWLHKKAAASAASQADSNAQSDAELAQLMMQQPLSYSGGASEPAMTSGPSIDTGNAALQALVNSVLNPPTPPAAQPSAPSQPSTPSSPAQTPTQPAQTYTTPPVNTDPAQGGVPSYHTLPRFVSVMPTTMVQ